MGIGEKAKTQFSSRSWVEVGEKKVSLRAANHFFQRKVETTQHLRRCDDYLWTQFCREESDTITSLTWGGNIVKTFPRNFVQLNFSQQFYLYYSLYCFSKNESNKMLWIPFGRRKKAEFPKNLVKHFYKIVIQGLSPRLISSFKVNVHAY